MLLLFHCGVCDFDSQVLSELEEHIAVNHGLTNITWGFAGTGSCYKCVKCSFCEFKTELINTEKIALHMCFCKPQNPPQEPVIRIPVYRIREKDSTDAETIIAAASAAADEARASDLKKNLVKKSLKKKSLDKNKCSVSSSSSSDYFVCIYCNKKQKEFIHAYNHINFYCKFYKNMGTK